MVDDEAGVHGVRAAVGQDIDGVGVSADIGTGLENGDVMVPAQAMGHDHPGNSCADYRNSHE
jgi:hypothetical protein